MADLSDKVSESEEMGSRNPSPERSGGGVNPKTCLDCGTSKTPLWRGGPAGPKTLCNACGIRSRKKRRALLGINKEDRDRKVKKTSSNNSSTTSSSKSSTIVVDQVDRRSKSSNIVVDQIDRRNKISTVVIDKTDRRSKISAVVVDQTDRRSKISTVVADQTDRSSKDENSCKSNSSSSGENNAAAATSAKYGETLRKKLVAFGRDFVMQRPRSKKSNGGQRRKMGEVEQAAFLLMALSCGSVYA